MENIKNGSIVDLCGGKVKVQSIRYDKMKKRMVVNYIPQDDKGQFTSKSQSLNLDVFEKLINKEQ